MRNLEAKQAPRFICFFPFFLSNKTITTELEHVSFNLVFEIYEIRIS